MRRPLEYGKAIADAVIAAISGGSRGSDPDFNDEIVEIPIILERSPIEQVTDKEQIWRPRQQGCAFTDRQSIPGEVNLAAAYPGPEGLRSARSSFPPRSTVGTSRGLSVKLHRF
jgi:hypothetical protein